MASPPGLTALCAGYEGKRWRAKALADHLIEWLPDFALKDSERERFGAHNGVALLREAARSIYTSAKYQRRGELGEILLHIAMRQVFSTAPAVAKYFFKDSANDTVKGFDAVHIVATGTSFELWLGEVKFYDDVSAAIADVVKELQAHTKRDYMRDECAFIAKKIDPAWPHAARLKALLHRNTSMDKIFAAVCIPVLLTYESATIAAHNAVSAAFKSDLAGEVRKHHRSFCSKTLPTNVKIHLFLIPLGVKEELVKAFDRRLRSHQ
ncbi:MAG: DUF1837 domain-containing protein [Gemmataceae bacterium]